MYEDRIRELFSNCSVGKPLGIEVCEVSEGFAKGKLTLREEHLNVFGIGHGGIIFTLGDQIGGVCGNTLGRKALLVESTIQYAKAVLPGDTLVAEARITSRGRKIGRIDISISRRDGEAVAFMHQLFFISDDEYRPTALEYF